VITKHSSIRILHPRSSVFFQFLPLSFTQFCSRRRRRGKGERGRGRGRRMEKDAGKEDERNGMIDVCC